uniref:Uncharacterized protein n=1 Tax=Arundo donax TaxID=35708 RepID=A0A0A9HW11_ARUDO
MASSISHSLTCSLSSQILALMWHPCMWLQTMHNGPCTDARDLGGERVHER